MRYRLPERLIPFLRRRQRTLAHEGGVGGLRVDKSARRVKAAAERRRRRQHRVSPRRRCKAANGGGLRASKPPRSEQPLPRLDLRIKTTYLPTTVTMAGGLRLSPRGVKPRPRPANSVNSHLQDVLTAIKTKVLTKE